MKPKRILFINGGTMQRGGIESFMMSYYRNIDRSKLQIDFIVHGYEKGAYDDEILSMGGKIFNVPVKSKDLFGNIKEIKRIFKMNDYKLVHSHMDAMSTFVLKIAKNCGIPIRIAHSHNTEHLTNNKIKYHLNEYARKNINKYATHYFACSVPAGDWLFGKKISSDGGVEIVKNAINLSEFSFDSEARRHYRKELNLESDFVVGHVGRFDYQKNHTYLLKIFKRFNEIVPQSKLVLIGSGKLQNEIEKYIVKLNLSDKVLILGTRSDVNLILNCFDVFLLPSHFEGLGISLIEAQANGLKCITSINTPQEANVSGSTVFMPTDEVHVEKWVQALLDIVGSERIVNLKAVKHAGYDIEVEALKLQNKYLKMLGCEQ